MKDKKLRLYRYTLEILDEPMGSDQELTDELKDYLEPYLEAFHVSLVLDEASDCMTCLEEMAEA